MSGTIKEGGAPSPPPDERTSMVLHRPFIRTRKGNRLSFGEPPALEVPAQEVRHPARVALQLALAHYYNWAIENGDIANRAALARQLGVSRTRITQWLDLALLPVQVQEAVLFMEAVDGKEPCGELALRRGLMRKCGERAVRKEMRKLAK